MSSGYCPRHGKTYFRAEGCPDCRQLSVLELTNKVYDRHASLALARRCHDEHGRWVGLGEGK